MRRLATIAAAIMAGLACPTEPETIIPAQPAWMAWPAEVRAGVNFNVRLVVHAPGCYPRQDLQVGVFRSAADIAFQAEWLVEGTSSGVCDPGYVDTLVALTGLPATTDSTYRVFAVPVESGPFLLMGTLLARRTAALSNNTGAAGTAVGSTDIEGCAVMQPPFDSPIPVENPPAATWMGFVRGYFFTPAAPLCGQTRAFHVDSLT